MLREKKKNLEETREGGQGWSPGVSRKLAGQPNQKKKKKQRALV